MELKIVLLQKETTENCPLFYHLNIASLNNPQVKEDAAREITTCIEINIWNWIYINLRSAAKPVIRRKFIASSIHIVKRMSSRTQFDLAQEIALQVKALAPAWQLRAIPTRQKEKIDSPKQLEQRFCRHLL